MSIVASDPNSVGTSKNDWRSIVRDAIRDPGQLLRRLRLEKLFSADQLAAMRQSAQQFPVFAPEPFVARMVEGDVDDPLLRQVLPVAQESELVPGFHSDAVGDLDAQRSSGLIHKYHGRALLITRGVCAVHCRYCFRRHFPYDSAPVSIQQFDETLRYVRNDATIHEVILSGGDPLMMVDARLEELIRLIQEIPHVRRLRIHSRLPIVIPSRVTQALLSAVEQSSLKTWFVIHANHPNEIDGDVRESVQRLADVCSSVLNQSVLLKGVNDDADVLIELSERLLQADCLPYYLHQLDRVQGVAHFEVDPNRGREIVRVMRGRLPGFAVPRYVREIAGQAGKTPL